MSAEKEAAREIHDFQTEVKQLLHLMIHSLYSNKEIFLRELISNASDAADKLRFAALADDALYEGDSDLKIHVSYDKQARTITVSDNGIGMSHDEVIENIGTIARSGTQQFMNSLSGDQEKDSRLIGQFGVGFYSSFIVADRVTLTARRAGAPSSEGVRWESSGEGSYSLESADKATHGTDIVLHLRENEDEFLDDLRLRGIIRKYSDHIDIPVVMPATGESGEEETVNRASALWARAKQDISEEEYNEFYKHVAHDYEDPLCHVHSRVEGTQEYISLFYVPARAPFDLWDRERQHGIKLYVRRVFIMDDTEHLMPAYLRFVRGVVDSNDLPLNVSREILQRNRAIDSIRAASVKKVLGMLESMAKDDSESYMKFWQEFGRVLKEGIAEDSANREQIARLLRFSTTHADSETQDISLQDYVARMSESQDKIYYVTADSFTAAMNSPHLEIFRKKNIEVLLLHDRVDEWLVSSLNEYEGKPLVSVARGDLDLGALEDEAEKQAHEAADERASELVQKIREALGDRVKDVRPTHRLIDSPACLVVDENEISSNLQRLLREVGQDVPKISPILEINPLHPLVSFMDQEASPDQFGELAGLLYEQALLSEGGQLDDPAGFVHRLNRIMVRLSQGDGHAPAAN
jgi:molecular chaperone HtpG